MNFNKKACLLLLSLVFTTQTAVANGLNDFCDYCNRISEIITLNRNTKHLFTERAFETILTATLVAIDYKLASGKKTFSEYRKQMLRDGTFKSRDGALPKTVGWLTRAAVVTMVILDSGYLVQLAKNVAEMPNCKMCTRLAVERTRGSKVTPTADHLCTWCHLREKGA